MQKYVIFISLILFLFIVSLTWNIYENPEPNSQLRNELENKVVNNLRITPSDENYDDLEFLKEVLENKKIVLLGEQIHYDGTTLLAKTRLVKYLHDSLGFDVLYFESGLYDIWLMNDTALKMSAPINPQMGLWWFWWNVEEMDELWNYIGQKTDNPLVVKGFDVQIKPGSISDSLRIKLIEHHLSKKGIDFSNYPSFKKLEGKMYWCTFQYHEKFFKQCEKDSILFEMDEIITELEECAVNYEDSIYLRYLKGLRAWYECTWKYNLGDPSRFQIRDSLMANNFFWHFVNDPDKKSIIWAANMHILNAENEGGIPYKTFGKRIREKYPDDCYSICFSSYCKLNNNNEPYETGSNLALEHELHEIGCRYGFIDFQSLGCTSPLKQDIVTRVNQKNDIYGKWTDMMDGLFFIDTMRVITTK
jgi:hypothetical protein